MTQYRPAGRRRIDRVLAPGFADHPEGLDGAQLRARRAEADQEETDLSYVRRLLQGRLDLLRAESTRRAEGVPSRLPRTDEELVAELRRVLADRGAAVATADVRYVDAEPSRVGEHRRQVEAVVADVEISGSGDLDDEALDRVTARLAELEREVSSTRSQVQQVLDALNHEVAVRVEQGRLPGDASLPTP